MKKSSKIICDLKIHIVLLGIGLLLLAALITDDNQALTARSFTFMGCWCFIHLAVELFVVINRNSYNEYKPVSSRYVGYAGESYTPLPRKLRDNMRIDELRRAIDRFASHGKDIPDEWFDELSELMLNSGRIDSKSELDESIVSND